MKPLNIRFLTLLTALAFLAFSGLAVAHPCQPGESPEEHKHCRTQPDDPTDPPSETVAYKVTGDLVTGAGWKDGNGKGKIGYINDNYVADSVWGKIDLSYFGAADGPFEDHGPNCFQGLAGQGLDGVVALRAGSLGKYKGSLATVGFWFNGKTRYLNNNADVAYTLTFVGTFKEGDWPPAIGESTNLEMTSWDMTTRNGWEIHNMACVGGGDEDSGFPGNTVIVTGADPNAGQ